MPLIVGCDGCSLTQQAQDTADEETAKRPPFTSRAAQAYPVSRADAGNGGAADGAIKPGHWTTVGFALRSNRDDRRGFVQVSGEASKPSSSFADVVDETIVTKTQSKLAKSIVTQRPVVLPKGQLRRFDTRMLAPMEPARSIESVEMEGEFVSTDSTSRLFLQPSKFIALSPQTYFFLVLTDRSERFTRLQTADWVRPYQNDFSFAQASDNYRIVIPPTEGVLPISETALDWTSTSVVFWDDIPTRAITKPQSNAMIDWLHFGGTLIVNGPRAADALSDKVWKPYLAIANNGSEELSAESVDEFLTSLRVSTDLSVAKIVEGLQGETPEISVAGQVHPEAKPIGEGDILYERRIGRGRLVQSRIDLMSEWMVAWKSYDSFFNSAILSRPSRKFRVDLDGLELERNSFDRAPRELRKAPGTDPAPEKTSSLPPLRQSFVDVANDAVHPAINTNLRFSSRDSILVREQPDQEQTLRALSPWINNQLWTHPVSGLGGWKDDSPMIAWCRATLAGEVGMTIPDSKLVFRSLLIYLVVLIPINYLVFRMLGRLEWAWLAIVPLSVLGALYVARAAQLDVGFARSRNEIALLEIPRGHERGHLTRVLGLYNSLASQYRFDFDTPDAAISVIESNAGNQDEGLFAGSTPELKFGYEAGIAMENVAVGSNSYRALHIEQMVDVEGPIVVADNKVLNQSELNLRDVYMVRRESGEKIKIAAIGDLSSNGQKSYQWQDSATVVVPSDLPMGIGDAMQRLISPANIEIGSSRLVARVEEPLGGLTITPDCQQVRSQTILLVHVGYADRPEIVPDQNLIDDFRR